ncbi:hypothetical protein KA089_00800 [Candidatus Woesebacteria bacterium]|nr:hypothetical protein [Candidatus Woesebacteria bacterium]
MQENKKYLEKANYIIQQVRASGSTRADIKNFFNESINLAMGEAFKQAGDDEALYEKIFHSIIPEVRKKLIEITLQSYGAINGKNVDYQQIVKILFEIEKRGGRQASEPRTIAGESLIITTLLAISLYPDEDLNSDKIKKFIEENYMDVYEKLIEAVKELI